jgi:hypothetical protein
VSQPGPDADEPPATISEVDTFLALFAEDPPGPVRTGVINMLLDRRAELARAGGQP